jgi:hypothetical protein
MEMLTIDDAAILERAKELCERSGIAWNLLSVTAQCMRVLTDLDRRECLMRARDELVRGAEREGVRPGPPPLGKHSAASQTNGKEELPEPPVGVVTPAKTRRVA